MNADYNAKIAPFINQIFYVTSPWWTERWGTIHKGLDIATPTVIGNAPVYSILEGEVLVAVKDQVSSTTGFGNYIIVKNKSNGYAYLFAHFNEVIVSVGDNVKVGQLVGYEGTSGDSTGIHLHVEMQDMTGKDNWFYSDNKSDYLDPTEFMGFPS